MVFHFISSGDVETFVIFSNRHEIRRLDLKGRNYVSLVSGLRNTIALDFFYNKSVTCKDGCRGDGSLIFWTDVVDDKIYKGTMLSNCKYTLGVTYTGLSYGNVASLYVLFVEYDVKQL